MTENNYLIRDLNPDPIAPTWRANGLYVLGQALNRCSTQPSVLVRVSLSRSGRQQLDVAIVAKTPVLFVPRCLADQS